MKYRWNARFERVPAPGGLQLEKVDGAWVGVTYSGGRIAPGGMTLAREVPFAEMAPIARGICRGIDAGVRRVVDFACNPGNGDALEVEVSVEFTGVRTPAGTCLVTA